MYRDHKIAIVVPAYNEERLIGKVLEIIPDYIDCIIVVDDASSDRTSEITLSYKTKMGEKLHLIGHEHNQGVGGAIISGHKLALSLGMQVVAIMAGDGQMSPADLDKILDPVVSGKCDYSKGNRFINGEAWRKMPKLRFFANAGLSMINKIASGYWHIADPQCGYTAISAEALREINLGALSKGYHFENSMLLLLNINNRKVMDVPIQAVYGIGESSGINEAWAVLSFSVYLIRALITRLVVKYIIRDFHPLILFYLFGFIFTSIGLLFGTYLILFRLFIGVVQATSALFATFLFTSGLQLMLFAMWFDKEYLYRI
ncbi:MAG: glycosyltransferase family 2 protein [Anaerolineales bacterium]|nr:glycosyltransferase family 2 protein [Anaerolineales bacterium]